MKCPAAIRVDEWNFSPSPFAPPRVWLNEIVSACVLSCSRLHSLLSTHFHITSRSSTCTSYVILSPYFSPLAKHQFSATKYGWMRKWGKNAWHVIIHAMVFTAFSLFFLLSCAFFSFCFPFGDFFSVSVWPFARRSWHCNTYYIVSNVFGINSWCLFVVGFKWKQKKNGPFSSYVFAVPRMTVATNTLQTTTPWPSQFIAGRFVRCILLHCRLSNSASRQRHTHTILSANELSAGTA